MSVYWLPIGSVIRTPGGREVIVDATEDRGLTVLARWGLHFDGPLMIRLAARIECSDLIERGEPVPAGISALASLDLEPFSTQPADDLDWEES